MYGHFFENPAQRAQPFLGAIFHEPNASFKAEGMNTEISKLLNKLLRHKAPIKRHVQIYQDDFVNFRHALLDLRTRFPNLTENDACTKVANDANIWAPVIPRSLRRLVSKPPMVAPSSTSSVPGFFFQGWIPRIGSWRIFLETAKMTRRILGSYLWLPSLIKTRRPW